MIDGALLVGRRVYIRAPRPSDAIPFVETMSASKRHHRPWVYAPITREAFLAYLGRCNRDENVGLLACRREDGAIAGVFNLNQIVRGSFGSAYLGYYGVARFAGLGYMSEGLALTLRFAFGREKLHRVEANIQPDNARSLRLAERAGFRKEGFSPRFLKIGGRWRDHERWAITIEDHRARNRRAR